MQSNEVKRLKAAVKTLIADYNDLIYTLAAISFIINLILAVILGIKINVHPLVEFMIVSMLLLTPIIGVKFLDHEYRIENDLPKEDDDY